MLFRRHQLHDFVVCGESHGITAGENWKEISNAGKCFSSDGRFTQYPRVRFAMTEIPNVKYKRLTSEIASASDQVGE